MTKQSGVVAVAGVALLLWLAVVIHQKNGEIAALNEKAQTSSAEVAQARQDTQDVNTKFVAFQVNVADLAQSDMIQNVNDAAGMGGAVASGCAPGYTRSSCDWWYGNVSPQGPPEARSWGAQALQQFSLPTILQTYGQDLVKRALGNG